MKNKTLLLILLLGYFPFYAQNTVSGFVNFEAPEEWEQSVYLQQLHLESRNKENPPMATAAIQENGFFAFDDDLFTSENQMYKVEVRRLISGEAPLQEAATRSVSFIISEGDSIYFPAGVGLFSEYTTNSRADKEWQKLRAHETESQAEIARGPEPYLEETRNYTKDSLQILLVKLLSIRTLEEQDLLQRDIKENAGYYLDLLEELQQSELPPATYAYLEQRITTTHQDLLKRKYYISLAVNAVSLLSIAGLLFVLFRVRRKNPSRQSIVLSRQEENIKALILEGKTNKEIAGELFISISTVKTHITNIYSKLDVSNRKELRLKS